MLVTVLCATPSFDQQTLRVLRILCKSTRDIVHAYRPFTRLSIKNPHEYAARTLPGIFGGVRTLTLRITQHGTLAGIQTLLLLPRITHLTANFLLQNAAFMTDVFIATNSRLTDLRSLTISATSVTEDTLHALLPLSQLTCLGIFEKRGLLARVPNSFPALDSLIRLNLTRIFAFPVQFSFACLRHLFIAECPRLNVEAWLQLAQLPCLQLLHISGLTFDGWSLMEGFSLPVGSFPMLHTLHLHNMFEADNDPDAWELPLHALHPARILEDNIHDLVDLFIGGPVNNFHPEVLQMHPRLKTLFLEVSASIQWPWYIPFSQLEDLTVLFRISLEDFASMLALPCLSRLTFIMDGMSGQLPDGFAVTAPLETITVASPRDNREPQTLPNPDALQALRLVSQLPTFRNAVVSDDVYVDLFRDMGCPVSQPANNTFQCSCSHLMFDESTII